MKKRYKNISINTMIFIFFIFILLGTVIATSYIPYLNWINLVNHTTIQTVEGLNDQIINELDLFVTDARHLNTMNKGLIEKNIVDMNDEVAREQLFVDALSSFESDSIYAFSYATKSGQGYGARKNENNQVEIARNNEETSGHTYYYSVENGRAGERTLDTGEIDPRASIWYKAGLERGQAVFSPVFKHPALNDLVISSSLPLYSEDGELQGVLGAHINLSRIDQYLQGLVHQYNACAMIVEKESGNIVANCSENDHFKIGEDGEIQRLSVSEMGTQGMPKAYQQYIDSGLDTYVNNCKKMVWYI